MENLAKLKWRCRRGTLELDILFQRYLENYYVDADPTEQALFLKLLELEDSELIRFFVGNAIGKNNEFEPLLEKMRQI